MCDQTTKDLERNLATQAERILVLETRNRELAAALQVYSGNLIEAHTQANELRLWNLSWQAFSQHLMDALLEEHHKVEALTGKRSPLIFEPVPENAVVV